MTDSNIKHVIDVIFWRLVLLASLLFGVVLIIGAPIDYVRDRFSLGLDSSDQQDPVRRSGLRIKTDYLTGCQYLETPAGHLTPRRGQDGRQICEEPEARD